MLCGAMPALILPLIEASAHWPERGALVGLDLGTKTIGVAVSDPDRRLATGVETVQRSAFKADAARLLAIAGKRNPVCITAARLLRPCTMIVSQVELLRYRR